MPSIQDRATTADGTTLLTRHWPPAGNAWASVLLVHGLGEHSGRYEHVGDQLAAVGIETFGFDNRGNGASGGRRGHVDRWSQYHDDLAERLAAVRAASVGRPVALYGHSLGGLIVAGYCLTDRPKPDLVVLSSPGLDSTIPAWKQRLAQVLGGLTPTLALAAGVSGDTLSRDPTVAAKLNADPLAAKRNTARFGAEALREIARVRAAAAGGLGMPTFVQHGEDDGLVPVAASAVFEGAPQTVRRTFPGLRHELHNEPEGAEIVDGVIAWLREPATARGTLHA